MLPAACAATVAVGLLAGCLGDAPRDNPLDPLAPGGPDAGRVEGVATGIYPPFEPRVGVRIRIVPIDAPVAAEHVVATGAGGAFFVDDLPAGVYAVRAEGSGYRPAADTVMVAVGATASTALRLDALPVVTAQALRTVHIERWYPVGAPVFQLEVEATATDPDRASDLAGAALVAPALGFRAPLAPVAGQPGRFAATFDASTLPGGRVQSLLGQALHIEASDLAGNVGVGAPLALVRVIEQTPLTLRPQNPDSVVANPPVLAWREANLPFPFTYTVEASIEDASGTPLLRVSQPGLPIGTTQLTLPTALEPGDYSWVVWVVDEAGNRSRSKPAGFRLQ